LLMQRIYARREQAKNDSSVLKAVNLLFAFDKKYAE
jgi:hypothetical protein